MHFLIDESKLFIFQKTPPMQWKIATVGGAILPYKGRKKWLKAQKSMRKGSDYNSEKEISEVLDVLIECGVKATLIIGDIGHVSLAEAEVFRESWIAPHYIYAQSLSQHRCEALEHHLNNLKGLGESNLSPQDFFKLILILETITNFIRWLTANLSNIRSIDIRKIKLIIDDQVKAAIISIKHFIHYFLWRRSHEGAFTCAPNSKHLLKRYLREEGDQEYLDTTKLFDEILVEEKANQDDIHSELKIADLIANFSRRALNGSFNSQIAKKLTRIITSLDPLSFGSNPDLEAELPLQNQDAIEILLKIPRL